MSDRAQRLPALSGVTLPSKPGLFEVRDAGPATRLIFRGEGAAVEAVGAAFGVMLPARPCRAAGGGERQALWLGPDEWMLIGPEQDVAALVARLADALGSEPHSLVDVSHRNAALILEGTRAVALLNAGCPLNLDLAAFPVGACARTIFGKAEIVLWRIGPHSFHLEAARSFLPYVVALITEAGRDGSPPIARRTVTSTP